MARASVRLNSTAVGQMLRGRDGHVGRVMAGFAGLATQEVRAAAGERVQSRTGAYLRGIRSTVEGDHRGPKVKVTASAPHSGFVERGTRAHVITPRTARVLRFTVGGATVFARRVFHPGTQPRWVLRDGVRRAGRMLHSLGRR